MPSRLIARGVRPSPPAPDAAPVPWPPSGAIWETGGQMSVDERIERSRLLYEQALFESDAGALTAAERELDGVEADLALARGRVIHGRFLEQRAEDPEQAREDPRELALFERAAELHEQYSKVKAAASLADELVRPVPKLRAATCGVRPSRCSGWAAVTSWSGATTRPRFRCSGGRWSWRPRPTTR